MRTLKLKVTCKDPEKLEDLNRMQKICVNRGYYINLSDIYDIWLRWSQSYEAGWLWSDHYSDDELFAIIQQYTEEDSDEHSQSQ